MACNHFCAGRARQERRKIRSTMLFCAYFSSGEPLERATNEQVRVSAFRPRNFEDPPLLPVFPAVKLESRLLPAHFEDSFEYFQQTLSHCACWRCWLRRKNCFKSMVWVILVFSFCCCCLVCVTFEIL